MHLITLFYLNQKNICIGSSYIGLTVYAQTLSYYQKIKLRFANNFIQLYAVN